MSGYYHVLLPALQVYSLPHESLHHFLLRYNYSSYNYRSDLPRKTAVSEHLLLLLYPVSLIICIYLLHLILQTDPSHHLNPCLIQLSLPVQLAFLPDIFLVPLRYKKKSLQSVPDQTSDTIFFAPLLTVIQRLLRYHSHGSRKSGPLIHAGIRCSA